MSESTLTPTTKAERAELAAIASIGDDIKSHHMRRLCADADRLEEDVDLLRYALWLRHGCSVLALYGDDGQMQCNNCGMDFKRLPVDEMLRIWTAKGIAALNERQGDNG